MNWSAVWFISGILLSALAGLMVLPAGLDMLLGSPVFFCDFLIPIGCCSFAGCALILANKRNQQIQIRTTDAFLLTSMVWALVPVFAGLPFYFSSSLHFSFADSWFEATSALTATGSSLLGEAAARLPAGLRLWRFILCYIGGAGMVIMAMVIFPILKIGGMNLFRSEFSEKSEKIAPSVSQMASWIVLVYSFAIIFFGLLLRCTGLDAENAFSYAISAVATCGICPPAGTPQALSNGWAEAILVMAMAFGGSSLLVYIKMRKGNLRILWQDAQIRAYIKTLIFCALGLSLIRWWSSDLTILKALRNGIFNTVSIITTAGFHNDDYSHWGPFASTALIFMSFIGGCTGSTSGGIKIFRFQVLFASIRVHILQLRRPFGVFVPCYNQQKITETTIISVQTFIALYLLTVVAATFSLSLYHVDFLSAFSGVVAMVGNVGLGVGDLVGPQAALSGFPVGPKLILTVCMILGRLELLTLLTLLAPSFWKK